MFKKDFGGGLRRMKAKIIYLRAKSAENSYCLDSNSDMDVP